MKKIKDEIVTFKVDGALLEMLETLPNRSEFIRKALLSALENVCPLCQGSGTLSPNQKKHWMMFIEDHSLRQCNDCQEVYLVCEKGEADNIRS